MSDLLVMWAAYGFTFAALGLYLGRLWLDQRKLQRAEESLGLAKQEEPDRGEAGRK